MISILPTKCAAPSPTKTLRTFSDEISCHGIGGSLRRAALAPQFLWPCLALVDLGNAFKSGIAELLAINAQLMVINSQTRAQDARRGGVATRPRR